MTTREELLALADRLRTATDRRDWFKAIVESADTLERLAAAQDDGWQTMESAPRDGTPIDVWLGDAEDADVQFYCAPETRRSPAWSWQKDKWRPVGGLGSPVFVQPTHWRHLPSPPRYPAQEGRK